MKIHLPSHRLQNLAFFTALALIAAAHPAHAQYAEDTETFNLGSGGEEDYYAVEQFTYINIDDDLNLDAGASVYALEDDDYEYDYDYYELEMDLTVTANGGVIDFDSGYDDGLGDATAECNDIAQSGSVYGADSVSSVWYGYWGFDDQAYLGEIYVSVATGQPAPYVDHINPVEGTVGDQNQPITFYGDNLLDSNGNLPNLVVDGTSALTVSPQGGNPGGQGSTSSQLFATYSISSGPPGMFDPIIDVVTDGGTSNDTNFYIGDAPATITSLSPSSWTAGTSFTLTITGTGFGTSPTVSITDPNNAVSTGNFTSSPDGTTIQISVSVSASAPLGDVASVVVTPGGLINGAMGYQSCNCGSNSSTNGSAQAIAMIGPGNCFARLKYRPAFGGVASHSFWWVLDPTGTQSFIDAGSQNLNCVGGCGLLVDEIDSGTPPVGRYPGDTVNATTWFDSGVSAGVCPQVSNMLIFAGAWPGVAVPYHWSGPNSNTFAYLVSLAGGFSVGPPPKAVGW